MWCLGCCPCCKGSANSELEHSGLLASPQWQSDNDATKTQYYTVRRISSFGRTGSGDDVSDSVRDHGDGDMRSPAEFWTPKIHRVQPDVTDSDYYGDNTDNSISPRSPHKAHLPQSRWRKALHQFRPRKEPNKTKEKTGPSGLNPPPITVSSPDLQGEETDVLKTSQQLQSRLRHAGTMTNVNSITLLHQTNWLKSQSMQDINTYQLGEKEIAAAEIARTYGLNTSLYTPDHNEGIHMSRSTEALNAWRTPDTRGKADWFQEAAYGTIHFTAAYFQKNKKLFVHVNKVEGLPPKGEHYTYSVVVKLVILPLDKPVRVSKIYKGDLNPEIEEDFEFIIKDPPGKVLRLSLYDADHQGKYDAIGHALFYLEDIIAGRPRRYAMRLYKQSQPDVAPGNIQLSLCYKRETMTLTVVIMEACNLMLSGGNNKTNRISDKYNTYIKVTYFSGGQKMKSRRGTVVANNRNPVYNQTFIFKLSSNFLHDCLIVVSVMMKSLLKKDVPIGRLILGPFHYTEGQEKTPWGKALLTQEMVTHWFRMYL
ncbi:synaptotagmin-15-like isoform X2 [Periplaneta americana]|uniref:synaptotagmin-15-like isoform X2 n=1 Tax=Periplaneta americana TaxID=6978 RepID=UPI0037E9523B